MLQVSSVLAHVGDPYTAERRRAPEKRPGKDVPAAGFRELMVSHGFLP